MTITLDTLTQIHALVATLPQGPYPTLRLGCELPGAVKQLEVMGARVTRHRSDKSGHIIVAASLQVERLYVEAQFTRPATSDEIETMRRGDPL